MSQLVGYSLNSCPEAYLQSLKSLLAAFVQPENRTLQCIEEHVIAIIADYVRDRLEDQSPFSVLSVGSGDGENDLPFLEILSKLCQGKDKKAQMFARAIEPNSKSLEGFRAKAEHLPESLKNIADVDFEWCPMTFQKYIEQKKKDDVKFDVVHFLHSIYYAGRLDTALEHCYEKELGAKGVILTIMNDEDGPFVKYGKAFSDQGLILNPGVYSSNKDVRDVAEKNGWKYAECPGETKPFDITTIFDSSSQQGNKLLDFLTHCVNVSETANQDNLMKILNFWQSQCFDDDRGRKIIRWKTRAVIILKGL
ncbi:histamine N-methyltransferase-like [Oculina patagonica]